MPFIAQDRVHLSRGASESEARQALNEETDAQGATYYHVILMREPGSNGNMHASADIYR
ncbi:DUF1471 domain-containing protein [Escherichia coli]|nr:DUF1471 domain-containing protein [Escherichia coli]